MKIKEQRYWLIVSCFIQLLPLIAIMFIGMKITVLDCISTTNKMWMILVMLYIFSYVNSKYVEFFMLEKK